ncbi:MAG TPA: cation:proton antiporter [Chloroflexia bacterium]|nr:cation:proton antiporter [Chloroflexia bacterium]
MSNSELVIRFFIQVALIMVTCYGVGKIFQKIGQPRVIAEIFVGILLGPSLFGLLLPDIHREIFPKASMSIIYTISQLGLVLYMFLIGAELEIKVIKQRFSSAIAVSGAGILMPFCLGILLALYLMNQTQLFMPGVNPLSAFLFLGAAMSITAFPVLARIIEERGLARTSLGSLALTAASIDDVVAWTLLALTLATLSNNPNLILIAVGGSAVYLAVVFLLVRPFLKRLGKSVEQHQKIGREVLIVTLLLVMLGAGFTEFIGIHAVFGAFVLGTALPRGSYTTELRKLIEPLTANLLIPLFFVYSGLNTQLNLIDSGFLVFLTLITIIMATVGKGGACYLAALLVGEKHREALGIGILMNTRGLVELIILNIGLEQKIISPTLFTIMVIMAIVTTFMTSPAFSFVYRHASIRKPAYENLLEVTRVTD